MSELVCVCVYIAKKVPLWSKDIVEVCNANSPFIDHHDQPPLGPLSSFAVSSLSYEYYNPYKIFSHIVSPYISALSISKSSS